MPVTVLLADHSKPGARRDSRLLADHPEISLVGEATILLRPFACSELRRKSSFGSAHVGCKRSLLHSSALAEPRKLAVAAISVWMTKKPNHCYQLRRRKCLEQD